MTRHLIGMLGFGTLHLFLYVSLLGLGVSLIGPKANEISIPILVALLILGFPFVDLLWLVNAKGAVLIVFLVLNSLVWGFFLTELLLLRIRPETRAKRSI